MPTATLAFSWRTTRWLDKLEFTLNKILLRYVICYVTYTIYT